MLYVSASRLCTGRPSAYVAGKAGGTASTQDAKAKKRQRQESDDEESGCTLSDHERTTGMCTSIACYHILMQPHGIKNATSCIIFIAQVLV